MAEEQETQMEIGHVLFIDIVDYPKLLVELLSGNGWGELVNYKRESCWALQG
jgi:hypothetical protein